MTDPKLLKGSVYWYKKTIFWINAVLLNFLFIKVIKNLSSSTTVSKMYNKSAYFNTFLHFLTTIYKPEKQHDITYQFNTTPPTVSLKWGT